MRSTCILLTTCIFAFANSIHADTDVDEVIIHKTINDSELNTPLFDISAVPNSIVGGVVNVITGNFVESDLDLVHPGNCSFKVERHFNSGSDDKGSLCHGWNLNFPSDINFQGEGREALVKDRGASLIFGRTEIQDKLKVSKKQLQYGVTNCSSGNLSSHTNIKNKKLKYRRGARHCELVEENGEKLIYKRFNDGPDECKYVIDKNILPNGCSIAYDYDHKDRISYVTLKGRNDNFLCNFRWLYPSHSNKELTLESSNGHKVHYKFQKCHSYENNEHRYCLTSVIKDNAPNVFYNYRYVDVDTMERLIRKSLPDHRFLEIAYYEKGKNRTSDFEIKIHDRNDSRVGRVMAIYAPVGKNLDPVRVWSFRYSLHKKHKTNLPFRGSTEVTDALGNRKIFRFSDEQRLTSIEYFLSNKQLYRMEKMHWKESGSKRSYLLSRGLTDANDHMLLRRDYTYDKQGNVLKEALYGNLTGQFQDVVSWQSYQKAEKHTKTYTYTEKGLLASENDGKRQIRYQYHDGTNLLKLKLICDKNGIRERSFFAYDENCAVVKEIVDDGCSEDIYDFCGVTERHIKNIVATNSFPIGLPEVIDDCYYNFSSGNEEMMTRVRNFYSKEGYLTRQDTYDSNSQFRFSKIWEYDSWGNVIKEIDPFGHATTYDYDANNNRIIKQSPRLQTYTQYIYDYANRLIQEKEMTADNKWIRIKSYEYDYMGNCIASEDESCNITKFTYDEFGRLTEKIYPEVNLSNGMLFSFVDRVCYDLMNNVSKKTDTNGNTISFKNTALGKPYEIEYSDGSIERNIYDVDGELLKSIDVNGVETCFTYDYKGRKIREEKTTSNGDSLSVQKWQYDAFHLIKEIDPAGFATDYVYENTGRLKLVRKGDSETKYVYDALGRQSEIWEMHQPGNYKVTLRKFDHLDSLVEEEIRDESRNLFTKTSYGYDAVGNRTKVQIHDGTNSYTTLTQYNYDNKPICITNPDRTEILFEYNNRFFSDWGKTVKCEKEIDGNRNITFKIMDSCGRLAQEKRLDAKGILLSNARFYLDGEGNQTERRDDIIEEGIVKSDIRIEFKYDSRNREIAVIEAAGTSLNKITQKEYFPNGQLARIIKPDDVASS